MRGAVQHWYVYGQSGQASFLFGSQEKQAGITRQAYEDIFPHNAPYMVVVYLVSKVDGSLMAGTLDDEPVFDQQVYNHEAS
jgi:hypothetical protein